MSDRPPARYRKKPCEIQAMRVPCDEMHLGEEGWIKEWGRVVGWLASREVDFQVVYVGPDSGEVHHGIELVTLEGTMLASPGDWLIRGVFGEFYPCKHDIFAATYEPAT